MPCGLRCWARPEPACRHRLETRVQFLAELLALHLVSRICRWRPCSGLWATLLHANQTHRLDCPWYASQSQRAVACRYSTRDTTSVRCTRTAKRRFVPDWNGSRCQRSTLGPTTTVGCIGLDTRESSEGRRQVWVDWTNYTRRLFELCSSPVECQFEAFNYINLTI